MEHCYNLKIFLHTHCSQFHPSYPGSGDPWSIFCPYNFAFSRMSYNCTLKFVTICIWFLSLVMMLFRFICVVGCISSSFHFVTNIPVSVPHFVYSFFLVTLQGLWDLSSPTRERTLGWKCGVLTTEPAGNYMFVCSFELFLVLCYFE